MGAVLAKVAATGGLLAIVKDAPNALKKRLDDIAALLTKLKNADLASVLEKDLANDELFDALDRDPEIITAWEALNAHSTLRVKPEILGKAKRVLAKGHISLEDLQEILRVNSGLASRAEAVADLLDDLDYLAIYKGQSGFGSIVSGLKADWLNGAGADGANWVIAALRKEGTDVFPAASTNFEVAVDILGNKRRYDAVVGGPNRVSKYYEFKSYKSVPPSNFGTQFLNDLNNPNITDLSNLKWLFDAAKNPPNFEVNMKKAIDALDLSNITDETLQKFGVTSRPALKARIRNEFSYIFYLK